MTNTRHYFYYYRINGRTVSGVSLYHTYSLLGKDVNNIKKSMFRRQVASFKNKPDEYIEPVLRDPFTVVEKGSGRIVFELTDPHWIAVVTAVMLKKI